MKHFLYAVLVGILMLNLSGCALVFNSEYQKVSIQIPNDAEIFINGDTVVAEDSKYPLKRDHAPKQITVKKEGFKDKNIIAYPYRRTGFKFMSFLGLATLPAAFILPRGTERSLIIANIVTYSVAPPLYKRNKRGYNYDKKIVIKEEDMLPVLKKNEYLKNVALRRVAVNLEGKNIDYDIYSQYKNYKENSPKLFYKYNSGSSSIKIPNTIFSDILNQVLAENGYIDTTDNLFSNNHQNFIYIDATIDNYKLHLIEGGVSIQNYVAYSTYDILAKAELGVQWKIFDYYGTAIDSIYTQTTSDEFIIAEMDKLDPINSIQRSIMNALDKATLECISSPKLQAALNDFSYADIEKAWEEFELMHPKNAIEELPDIVQASVAIESSKDYGSGFILNDEGYILTNYHIINGSEEEELKIITYQQKEYTAKLIRASKTSNVALLKIVDDTLAFTALKIGDPNSSKLAEIVYAVGTPSDIDYAQTISRGIISSQRERSKNSSYIQTDVSVNYSNSGGALVNKKGQVLGIISNKLVDFGIEGLAFAIPIDEALTALKIKWK